MNFCLQHINYGPDTATFWLKVIKKTKTYEKQSCLHKKMKVIFKNKTYTLTFESKKVLFVKVIFNLMLQVRLHTVNLWGGGVSK